MAPARSRKLTQIEVIIECYEQFGAQSVGRRELEAIVDTLRQTFGAAIPSPATIARILADHQVPLSHPDVLDVDTEWRERQLSEIVAGDLDTIETALKTVGNVQSLATRIHADEIDRLRFQVRQVQEELELLSQSQLASRERRSVAAELASWLTVWLQNPAIFDDWLNLRRNSPQFLQKFG